MDNPHLIFNARREQIKYTMDQKKALMLIETFLKRFILFTIW